MKTNINYISFNEKTKKRSRRNSEFSSVISPFHHKLDNLLETDKKNRKHRNTVVSRKKNNNKTKILNHIQLNENLYKYKTVIDTKKFYKIRNQIYQNFKRPYISPYLQNSFIQKKYAENLIDVLSFLMRGKIYDYNQICYLMNKDIKHLRLKARFNDNLLYDDDQEYLMKLFNKSEQYIIMKYLLYQIYDRDILTISNNPTKSLSGGIIINLFNKLKENNYESKDAFGTISKDKKKDKKRKSNIKDEEAYLEHLKPVLKSKIKYLYIKDIPKHLIPKCSPNLFPQLSIPSFNLEIYLNFRKDNFSSKFESIYGNKQKENKVESYIKQQNINNKYKEENKSIDNKDNIFDNNISSDEDIKEEIPDFQHKNNDKYHHRVEEKNDDIKEIKNFILKFNNKLIQRKNNKDKKILFKLDNLKSNIKKQMSYIKNNGENKPRINEYANDKSLHERKKNIILYNKKYFSKIAKKVKYKASTFGSLSSSKIAKDSTERSTNNNCNSKSKYLQHQINQFITKFQSTRNKKGKYIMKIPKKPTYDRPNKNPSIIKAQTISGNQTSKSSYNVYKKMSHNDDNDTKYEKNTNDNTNINSLNTKYLNQSNSLTVLHGIQKRNIKQFLDKSMSHINKSQIYNLKMFEKIYKETKRKGLLPKSGRNYKSISHKPFEAIYGFNIMDYITNKESNKLMKLEENQTRNDYLTEKLKRNKKYMILKQNSLFSNNDYSLRTMAKCPNLYFKEEKKSFY